MSSESLFPQGARNQTDVYAVHGADPEVLAYAMAKYSRSALSMRESLSEINTQRAEQFLNTFYFQYGHRSIADLAHIAFAVERLSLLAAILLVDEQRWDGQERTTRYQDFRKSGWFFPDFGPDDASAHLYVEAIEGLFAAYEHTSTTVLAAMKERIPRPDSMKPELYERTLRARAFDVARYLLPLATNTSLGQIVSARALETQISRLVSYGMAEIRDLGRKLRDAASTPAWNVSGKAAAELVAEISRLDPDLGAKAAALLTREVRCAPTLVKHAEPNPYRIEARVILEHAAHQVLGNIPVAPAPLVDLVERTESLEVEIAATLLYWAGNHPFRQVRDIVTDLPEKRINEIIEVGLRHRGRHDEALRSFSAGQALRFDILMDIGGFRDLHRHRRCIQTRQGFTAMHGYEIPDRADGIGLAAAGIVEDYCKAIDNAFAASARIAAANAPEAPQSARYLLPLATRVRCLFKMDWAEAQYITELRTAPSGHFSYRRVAWEMFLAMKRQYPLLSSHIRATDFSQPIDLLQR